MTINKAIALRISNLLTQNNMSQYELSKRSTVEQSTITRILNEETIAIKTPTIFKIADAFGLTIFEFYSDEKLFSKSNIEIYY